MKQLNRQLLDWPDHLQENLENTILELSYALDTFYFLVMGAFVMWMAAGFTMLESGLVRARNTVEILTKNIALYSISCIMFMIVGYNLMYPGGGSGVIKDVPDNSKVMGYPAVEIKNFLKKNMNLIKEKLFLKIYLIYLLLLVHHRNHEPYCTSLSLSYKG